MISCDTLYTVRKWNIVAKFIKTFMNDKEYIILLCNYKLSLSVASLQSLQFNIKDIQYMAELYSVLKLPGISELFSQKQSIKYDLYCFLLYSHDIGDILVASSDCLFVIWIIFVHFLHSALLLCNDVLLCKTSYIWVISLKPHMAPLVTPKMASGLRSSLQGESLTAFNACKTQNGHQEPQNRLRGDDKGLINSFIQAAALWETLMADKRRKTRLISIDVVFV